MQVAACSMQTVNQNTNVAAEVCKVARKRTSGLTVTKKKRKEKGEKTALEDSNQKKEEKRTSGGFESLPPVPKIRFHRSSAHT